MAHRQDVHERISGGHAHRTGSDRAFGVVFAVATCAFGIWLLRHDTMVAGLPAALFVLPVTAFFLVATLVRPALLSPLNKAWAAVGYALQRVTNPLLLGIVFFAVIFPVGLLMRAAGKDLLRLRRDKAASTYWRDRRPPGPSPESMSHQF